MDTYLIDYLPTVKYTYINNTYERIDQLKEKKIDALVAIEPFITDVLQLPNTEITWHSNQINACYVMWCFSRQFVESNPDSVRRFHTAQEEAIRFFNRQTSQEKINLFITHCHFSEKDAYVFKDFTFESQKNYSSRDFLLCQDWMFNNGEIDQKVSPDIGIFNSF